MLPTTAYQLTDMGPDELKERLNRILQAIAAGRSCEQILTADPSLSYHDIFHAIAEAPTTYWTRISARRDPKGSGAPAHPSPAPAKHRID